MPEAIESLSLYFAKKWIKTNAFKNSLLGVIFYTFGSLLEYGKFDLNVFSEKDS